MRFYWLLFALFLPVTLQAQAIEVSNDTMTVQVIAWYTPGDAVTLTVEQGKVRVQEGTVMQADSSMTRYRVSVESETEDAYVMRWQVTDYDGTRDLPNAATFDLSLLTQTDFEGFRYSTNVVGNYLEPIGADSLVALLQQVLSSVVDEVAATERERAQVQQLMRQLFNPQVLALKLYEPMQLYHQFHGYEWVVGHTMTYDSALPNPFGGPALPSKIRFHAEVDTLAATVTIRQTQDVDPDAFVAFFSNLMAQMEEADAASFADSLATLGFSPIRDVQTYVIDYETGWVHTLDWERTMAVADLRQRQFMRIRLVEPK